MPVYRNDTAARITWGSGWIDPGQTKISPDHWPYTELGLTLVSTLPLVATPIKHSQRVSLAAPSAAVGAAAILTVATGKTLTFTAGFVDHPSFAAGNAALAVQGEGLAVAIEANQADALAVSNPSGTNVILVKLASTTASKNTDELIQAAVRALGTVDGVSVADMTVVGNAAFIAAPVIGHDVGTAAGVVLDFGSSKTLTISSVYPGSWYNDLSFAVETAEDDNLAVGESGGLITIQLADTTGSKNSASNIETLVRALTIEGIDLSAATVTESSEYAAARPITGDIAETPMTGGDEEVVAETDLEGGTDGTTISTVALNSYGKGNLSLVVLAGEVEAKLGDSTLGIPLSTSVDYQGVHQYKKVHQVVLTGLAAAVVVVAVEEAE